MIKNWKFSISTQSFKKEIVSLIQFTLSIPFPVDKDPYDFDYLGKFVMCMFLLGCFFFSLTLAIEYKFFTAIKRLVCRARDK